MIARTHSMTADELLERSRELGPCELVRGELVKTSPAGAEHGHVTNRLAFLISRHVYEHDLGRVYSAETGFVLERNPDTVREADIPFVSRERLPGEPVGGFFEGAPDLAIEVLSPGDRASETAAKIDEWFAGGARQVWVVDWKRKTVTLHRTPDEATVLREGDVIENVECLPGLKLPVSDIFA